MAPTQFSFLDCLMPEMDGFDACHHIRAHEMEGRCVSIVAMTANALKGDREHCLAAAMDDYLPKQVRVSDLQAMVWRWGGSGRAAVRFTACVGSSYTQSSYTLRITIVEAPLCTHPNVRGFNASAFLSAPRTAYQYQVRPA